MQLCQHEIRFNFYLAFGVMHPHHEEIVLLQSAIAKTPVLPANATRLQQ